MKQNEDSKYPLSINFDSEYKTIIEVEGKQRTFLIELRSHHSNIQSENYKKICELSILDISKSYVQNV